MSKWDVLLVEIDPGEPINQCDGCRRGLVLDGDLHRDDSGMPVMGCTADRYLPQVNSEK